MGNTVEAIAYLLSGIGAQKNVGDVNSPQDTKDIPLTMDMLADKDTWMSGNGYEIKNHGGIDNEESHQRNYIVGTTPNWQLQKKIANIILTVLNGIIVLTVNMKYRRLPNIM